MAGTTAIVLAGGASRRMGGDKRLLRLYPTSPTFLERTVAIGWLVADRVAVIGGSPLAVLDSRVSMIADVWPAQGPLGALLTALRAFPGDRLVVLAIDYPLLQASSVVRVIQGLDGHDAAIAVGAEADGHRRHPLVGAYDGGRCSPAAGELFDRGERSMDALLAQLNVRAVSGDDEEEVAINRLSLANVNTPSDVDRLRRAGTEMDRRRR